MTYIYIATYVETEVYLYVGSHTWDGPSGEIDTSYFGSSRVAANYGWLPVDIQILENVALGRKFIAERYWIEKYAEQYGIADCARLLTKNKKWVANYKAHGFMLNCHANDASQATEAARARIIAEGKSELQRAVDLENLLRAHEWYKEHLKDSEFYNFMCSKAAYARSVALIKRREYGITEKQAKAYSKHAVEMNMKRRMNGSTERQQAAVSKSIVNTTMKRHLQSRCLLVISSDGKKYEDHCKELSEQTGLNYGTLRSYKCDLEAGLSEVTLTRGKFRGWIIKLGKSYTEL